MDWLVERLTGGQRTIERLLAAAKLEFNGSLRSALPARPGLYAISVREAAAGEFLRAGRAGDLQQRVYQNHLMGNQTGNLRSQLVRDGVCASLEEAKTWIRTHCLVQFAVIQDEAERRWGEHIMLSLLRPRYSD